MNFISEEKGQTLIEILVAMGTAVVIISAITVAVVAALYNAQYSKNQNLASQYAQEGMEIMKKIRDSSWTNFNTLTEPSYCLDKNQTTLAESDKKNTTIPGCEKVSGGQPSNVDNFSREVDIDKNSDECSLQTKVSVFVSWSDSKCRDGQNPYCHTVSLVSCFTDFNNVSNP